MLLGGAVLLAAPVGARAAQESEVKPLEELIVTAQRRSENLQSVGTSASVLTGDDLLDKSVFGLTALQYAAPSVTISDMGSANVFNIRGVGRSQVDVDLPSGVVIYRDGAPTLAGYFQNEPYFDMESVEILRGPQGTFVGKSAAGGAVFINTRDPNLEERTRSVSFGAGEWDQFEFTGVVNQPLSENVALRLAYHHLQRNDFYDSITGNFSGEPGTRDLHTARIGVLWTPSEALELLLKVDISDLDFGGNVVSSPGDDPYRNVDQNANFAYEDESVRAVFELNYELASGITLRSLSAYQGGDTVNNVDLNATEDLFYVFNSAGDLEIASQEFNLISPQEGDLRWVLGAYYQRQTFEIPDWRKNGFTFTGFVFGSDYPWGTSLWDKEETDWAVFAHVAFDLTDALELEVGVRYSDYETDQATEWLFGDGTSPPMIPWPFSVPPASAGGDKQDLSETSVDWKVGLNWQVDPDNFVYGLVSRGHITGGINIFPPFFDYDESEVINYEVGWKKNWSEGRVKTQLNVFFETFDNFQARFANVGIGPANIETFRNASDDSELYGIEFSAQAVLGNWGLDVGMAWLENELGTFQGVVNPFTLQEVDLSGGESPFAPEFTGNIGIEYNFRVSDGLTVTPRVDFSHLSTMQSDVWPEDVLTLESRNLVNFQVRIRPSTDRWHASLFVTNVTDKEYVAGIQNSGTLNYAGAPRQAGFRMGFNF